MTFLTDLDKLISHHHGDVQKLREIRDTIRHDNFITTDDKNYVEELINEHLKERPLEKLPPKRQSTPRIKLTSKQKTSNTDSPNSFTFNFSSNKNRGILGGGAAAAIAIIILVGFTATNQDDTINSSLNSTPSNPLLMSIDQTKYQRADIISVSGDAVSGTKSITLSIENPNGVKIWNESIDAKNNGNFSTLIIAGGGGWENNGLYTIKATQDDLVNEIEFRFVA